MTNHNRPRGGTDAFYWRYKEPDLDIKKWANKIGGKTFKVIVKITPRDMTKDNKEKITIAFKEVAE